MDESIMNNDIEFENDEYRDVTSSMIACPDCENLVPARNLELHRLRACPSNSETNGNRRRENMAPVVNIETNSNISTAENEHNDSNNSNATADDDSVVVVTTMADSWSRRPRKTRRGNINKNVIQSQSSSMSLDNDSSDDGNDNNESSDIHAHSDRKNIENEIIDLLNESDISSDREGASARAVDLTENVEEDDENEDDDRKMPARDSTTDNNPSDNEHHSNDEWSCPRCTLLNKNTVSRCDACHYLNSDIQQRMHRDTHTARGDLNTPERTSRRRQQQPVSTSSPLGFIGSGALLGAAVGMAGNWMRGRSPLSGAFEGGTTGAVGGALLHEVIQNNNSNRNNHEHETATTSARSEAATYTTHNHGITGTTSARRWPHYVEGGSFVQSNSRINTVNSATSARSSTSMEISETTVAENRNVRTNTNTNTNNYSDPNSYSRRSYRSRSQTTNNSTRSASQISNEARMNFLVHHQLQRHGNRDGALSGLIDRVNSSAHLHQLQTIQLLRQWNTRSDSTENDVDTMNYEQLLNAFGDGTENMGAEEGEIRRLPIHTVGDNPLPEDARQCLICLEDFEKGDSRTILPCLHGFHQNCCRKWLTTNGKCPVCKHPISSNG